MTDPAGMESDKPGGDLTEHGADPVARQVADTDQGGAGVDSSTTAGEQIPAGDLTDHGVDPTSRN